MVSWIASTIMALSPGVKISSSCSTVGGSMSSPITIFLKAAPSFSINASSRMFCFSRPNTPSGFASSASLNSWPRRTEKFSGYSFPKISIFPSRFSMLLRPRFRSYRGASRGHAQADRIHLSHHDHVASGSSHVGSAVPLSPVGQILIQDWELHAAAGLVPVSTALGKRGSYLKRGGAGSGASSALHAQVLQRGVGNVENMADIGVRLALAVKHSSAQPLVSGAVIPHDVSGDGVGLPLNGFALGGSSHLRHGKLGLGKDHGAPLGLASHNHLLDDSGPHVRGGHALVIHQLSHGFVSNRHLFGMQ